MVRTKFYSKRKEGLRIQARLDKSDLDAIQKAEVQRRRAWIKNCLAPPGTRILREIRKYQKSVSLRPLI